jgi:hypothetical protein
MDSEISRIGVETVFMVIDSQRPCHRQASVEHYTHMAQQWNRWQPSLFLHSIFGHRIRIYRTIWVGSSAVWLLVLDSHSNGGVRNCNSVPSNDKEIRHTVGKIEVNINESWFADILF